MTTHSHPRWTCLPRAGSASPTTQALHWWRGEHCGHDDAQLVRTPHGKPVFAPPYAHHGIGWSHTDDVLLIATGTQMDVGVDVEALQRQPRVMAIAQRYFHPDEVALLATCSDEIRTLRFLQLWCGKEAVLKADGRGIAFGLHRVRFALDREGTPHLVAVDAALGPLTAWRVQWLTPTPATLGALAWRTHAGE